MSEMNNQRYSIEQFLVDFFPLYQLWNENGGRHGDTVGVRPPREVVEGMKRLAGSKADFTHFNHATFLALFAEVVSEGEVPTVLEEAHKFLLACYCGHLFRLHGKHVIQYEYCQGDTMVPFYQEGGQTGKLKPLAKQAVIEANSPIKCIVGFTKGKAPRPIVKPVLDWFLKGDGVEYAVIVRDLTKREFVDEEQLQQQDPQARARSLLTVVQLYFLDYFGMNPKREDEEPQPLSHWIEHFKTYLDSKKVGTTRLALDARKELEDLNNKVDAPALNRSFCGKMKKALGGGDIGKKAFEQIFVFASVSIVSTVAQANGDRCAILFSVVFRIVVETSYPRCFLTPQYNRIKKIKCTELKYR